MATHRHNAEVKKQRDGVWAVKITLNDGRTQWARPGVNQRIIYERPEHLPTHLRDKIVPKLMAEARIRNMKGI